MTVVPLSDDYLDDLIAIAEDEKAEEDEDEDGGGYGGGGDFGPMDEAYNPLMSGL